MSWPTDGSSSVALPRLVLGLILGSAVFAPSLYQSFLDSTWAFLLQFSVYRASTFETLWTVLIYAVVEASYTYRFVHNPQLRLAARKSQDDTKSLPKMQRPKHRVREGLTYIAPLLLMDLTMIKKFRGVQIRDIVLSGNYDINTEGISENFLAPTLHHFTWRSPLQIKRALPLMAPTSRQLVCQLGLSILVYDAVFFWFHLALHKLPILSKLHAIHHKHSEIYPQITNQLDIVERLGLVLLANFSLNIIGSHVLTRTLFVPMFVWLLVDIHSGLDQAWGYDKLLPRGWAAGSKRHSHHHQYGTKFYEPFFNWWDDGLQWAAAGRAG
ncbi:uncharacterized protein KY384_003461 [Bacidia gigantensis]|uniref:uncharacterized protein n=1 Tax=Bacidia gigantensis TaxID=2732470 RepID=UPI001D0581C2|nr:uncharacterized protein KY384_003461 [Bacidia gigantensis]KAG8531825.1 hypothetical protein KY384_003461 [Bacidia gigantensis]